jgi:hypothetical protein
MDCAREKLIPGFETIARGDVLLSALGAEPVSRGAPGLKFERVRIVLFRTMPDRIEARIVF